MKKDPVIQVDSDQETKVVSDDSATARVEYWNRDIPWTFKGEAVGYEEKRRLRYSLQDYMHDVIAFSSYKSKLVLDLGSGGGIDSAEFARNGAEVVSLDFTETATRTTRDLFKSGGHDARVVKASAPHLPFRGGRFDCVYSFGVLHHIPEIERALNEISRVLKPGGEVICMLYNRDSLLYAFSIMWMHRNEGLDEQDLVRKYSERILGCPYTRAYTKEDIAQIFGNYFDNIRIVAKYNVIDLPDRRKFKLDIPDRYELGWHTIVHAQRKTA